MVGIERETMCFRAGGERECFRGVGGIMVGIESERDIVLFFGGRGGGLWLWATGD